MTPEKFLLSSHLFAENAPLALGQMWEDKYFTDVTLATADHQEILAHRVVLSSYSEFFKAVLTKHPHQNTLLFLKGINHSELESVLEFMYRGQVEVASASLQTFLAVARDLGVSGLEAPQHPDLEVLDPSLLLSHTPLQEITNNVGDNNPKPNKLPRKIPPGPLQFPEKSNGIDTFPLQSKKKQLVVVDIPPEFRKPAPSVFTCETCGTQFLAKATMETHKLTAHSWKVYKCELCNFKTVDRSSLRMHTSEQHEVKPDINVLTSLESKLQQF